MEGRSRGDINGNGDLPKGFEGAKPECQVWEVSIEFAYST